MAEENESVEPGKGTDETLILGKFKTQEDLTKSYSELEASFTRMSQELAENKRAMVELQTRQPVRPEEEEQDVDDLFFREPAKATEKVIKSAIGPIYNFLYEQQKEKFRDDPDFVKYESEIDTLINMQPGLKMQPGIIGQVLKMVKGLHFDPADFKRKVLEEHQASNREKTEGGLEGASAPGDIGKKTEIKLTSDEQRVAVRFNPGLSKEEAYKKYAEKKAKLG